MNWQPEVSVIIPTRKNESVALPTASLMKGTFQDLEIIVIVDKDLRGQAWARNRGLERATGRFVLFSDSDIDWAPTAIEDMHKALVGASTMRDDWKPGFVYCCYKLGGAEFSNEPYNYKTLRHHNFISTMSLVDRLLVMQALQPPLRDGEGWDGEPSFVPWFDESLRRLEDYDLWLTLGEHKIGGVQVTKVLFSTAIRIGGVSIGNPLTHEIALEAVSKKHNLTGNM